ncbi:MAG: DUF5106 domain-containing protein [Coprobacter sp.]|nr:DUF5106 domain-containing protein [Coprobacter sp.]
MAYFTEPDDNDRASESHTNSLSPAPDGTAQTMKLKIYIPIFAFCLLAAAEGLAVQGAYAKGLRSPVTDRPEKEELPLPVVPDTLRTPAERAGYIVTHFWDAMNFKDSRRAGDRDFMEQNFANFVSLFPLCDTTVLKPAVGQLWKRAESSRMASLLLADTAEKYLYETASPFASEPFYQLFLEQMVHSPALSDYSRIRYGYQLEAVRKNQPGMPAADFDYVTREGSPATLYRTPVRQQLLLLFFDPDCDHCRETLDMLKESPDITAAVTAGTLDILAVYSGDDRELWEETVAPLPAAWTVGINEGSIYDTESFVLRSMPTLYLLDRDKRVVLKNIRPENLTEELFP